MYKAEKRPTKATHRDEEVFDSNGSLACKIAHLQICDVSRLYEPGGMYGS
jgi:hypothetical protein